MKRIWLARILILLFAMSCSISSQAARRRQIESTVNSAWALFQQRQLDASLERYEEAMQLMEANFDVGQAQLQADALLGMSITLGEMGRDQEALARSGLALEWAGQLNDPVRLALCEQLRGRLFAKLGRYNESQAAFERELSIARFIGDRRVEMVALYSLGGIHGWRGNYDESIRNMEAALQLARGMNDASWIMRISHELVVVREGNAAGQAPEFIRNPW
jgi:tetratricopeptide (TPR) repeat protein